MQESLPSRMFAVLRECGALTRLLPELDALWGAPSRHHPEADAGLQTMLAIDAAARQNLALPVRFAALLHDLNPNADTDASLVSPVEAVCERLRVPHDCRDLALMTAREYGNVERAPRLDADAVVCLIERCDALRKPQRFADMLQAVACSLPGGADQPQPQRGHLLAVLAAAQAVDAGRIAADTAQAHPGQPQRIAPALHAARVAAVEALSHRGGAAPP
jgi:tRNA nucleotidyltransferase (CCA-adding enzyme)